MGREILDEFIKFTIRVSKKYGVGWQQMISTSYPMDSEDWKEYNRLTER